MNQPTKFTIEDLAPRPPVGLKATALELTRFLAPNQRIKTPWTRASIETKSLRSCVSLIGSKSGKKLGVNIDKNDGTVWIVRYE